MRQPGTGVNWAQGIIWKLNHQTRDIFTLSVDVIMLNPLTYIYTADSKLISYYYTLYNIISTTKTINIC